MWPNSNVSQGRQFRVKIWFNLYSAVPFSLTTLWIHHSLFNLQERCNPAEHSRSQLCLSPNTKDVSYYSQQLCTVPHHKKKQNTHPRKCQIISVIYMFIDNSMLKCSCDKVYMRKKTRPWSRNYWTHLFRPKHVQDPVAHHFNKYSHSTLCHRFQDTKFLFSVLLWFNENIVSGRFVQ